MGKLMDAKLLEAKITWLNIQDYNMKLNTI